MSTLRELHNQPYITDNENYILDCDFGFIDDPKSLEKALNSIVGIVDSGLFINMTDKVLIGDEHSVKTLNNTI